MADSDAHTIVHGDFTWNELGTRDRAAALDFYPKLFGWEVHGPDGPYPEFSAGGRLLGGLFDLEAHHLPPEVPNHWLVYVHVDDTDAAVAKAKELGGTVIREPFDIPDSGRIAILQDPAGAVFGVSTGATKTVPTTPTSGCFDWNELATPDAAAVGPFYAGLFGWTAEDSGMPGMAYTIFKRGESGLAGMMEMKGDEWKGVPPHWMSYVTVEDCDTTAEKAAVLGAEIKVPPTDVPGIGRFCVIVGPTGAVLAAISYTEMPAEAQ